MAATEVSHPVATFDPAQAPSLIAERQTRILEQIAEGEPLPEILEAIARLVETRDEGRLCSILLLEGDRLRHGAAPGLPEAYNAAIDGIQIGPAVGSCGTAAFTRKPVVVSDIEHDPLWVNFKDLAGQYGLRACWSTPIVSRRGDVLGTFAVYFLSRRTPNQQEEQLVRIATHLTRIALERARADQEHMALAHAEAARAEAARTEAELRERTAMTEFQAEIGFALTQGGGLRVSLQRCAEAMVRHLDAAFARVWTLNEATRTLELQASAGLYTHLDGAHGRVPVGALKIGLIASERQPHLTNEVLGDPRVGDQEWARREGMVAFAGYPLVVEERVVGVMALFARHTLSQTTLDAMAAVANAIGLGVERERAAAVIAAEQARLTDLFTNAPAIIAVLRGPLHVFALANPAYLELVNNRELIGKTLHDAFPELDERTVTDLPDRVYASGEPYIGNEVASQLDRDGDGVPETYYFNFVYQPTRGADGAVDGLLIHAVEVTEQVTSRQRVERLAEDLTAANRELEAFSYSVSHDLRAPLRAVDGFARILQEEHAQQLDADGQRYLKLVRDNAKQMGQLVDDLLTFSRLSRQELARRTLDPAEIARQVLEELRVGEDSRPVRVTIGQLPAAEADPTLLRQVFANLLGNALKFTRGRDPAEIEVGARQEDGETVYYVRDNGVGFDPRYAHKLFGVFQRLHRAEEFEGTGVGLAIVQRVLARHGGRVWAESQVEQGATFSFTLGQSQTQRSPHAA